MKKKKDTLTPKYFRFKFTRTLLILSVAALAVCALGMTVSIINIYQRGIHELSDWLKYPFLILVSVFLAVLVIALLIRSQYIVDEKNFTTQFGLIKSSCPVKNITSVVLDRDTNKLTVYMGEEYSVVGLSTDWKDDFVRALLDVNPDIDYSYTIRENTPDGEEKKK